MTYAEISYFDGFHFAHIAAHEDRQRLIRSMAQTRPSYRRIHRDRLSHHQENKA